MRVHDSNSTPVGNSSLDRAQGTDAVTRGERGAADRAGGSHADDSVRLSSLASSLRGLSADSPERTSRLAELTALVQSGRYHVDPAKLSSRLVDETLKLE